MNEKILQELLARSEEDQRIRRAAEGLPAGQPLPPDLADEWEQIDRANTAWLKQTVKEHGWPGFRLVGADGAQAAWLLAQHADRDPEDQREFLKLITAAVDQGDASSSLLAYLTDRVRVHDGSPQLYGTQIAKFSEGRPVPFPIADEKLVDARREEVGLGPLAEYLDSMAAG